MSHQTPPARPPGAPYSAPQAPPDWSIAGVLTRLSQAREADRETVLRWAVGRLAELGMPAVGLLISVAVSRGMTELEARQIIDSALLLAPASGGGGHADG